MATGTIIDKVPAGQLIVPVALTAVLLVLPPAIACLIWQTMPKVAVGFISIWQASPVFLALLLICAGIMTMLLPVILVWGLWRQRQSLNESAVEYVRC